MPADTVRVGYRSVPLAEIEEQAQRPSFRYNPQYEGCAVVILALVAAVRALRATNTRLHRRCQEAEAALPSWEQIKSERFVQGNLGRALLAWYSNKLTDERAALRAQVARDHEIDEHGGCRLCTPPDVSLEDSAFPCAVRRALLGEEA